MLTAYASQIFCAYVHQPSVVGHLVALTMASLHKAHEQAELGLEQATAQVDLTRQQRRLLALGQYLDLEKVANREQVMESNIRLTEQLISNIKEKQREGLALRNDVTRYQLQLQTLKINLTKLHNERSILNHQLCNSLGLNIGDSIVPIDDVAQQRPRSRELLATTDSSWQPAAAHSRR